ncbi:MAG TPA: PIN domain-containing protein [Candidatus Brocadiia bacterium]|nr:PIN domain-containing protein [Planctomycetota bacterium]MDO8094704.1 PIN domain-containing protein [Candidatus Brocadiales bacterium]
MEKGMVNLSFIKLLSTLEENVNYQIIPFDTRLLKIAQTLKRFEVHDRLILATATLTNSPIVTKDKDMTGKGILAIW